MKKIGLIIIVVVAVVCAAFFMYCHAKRRIEENRIFKKVVSRLETDSRVAEMMVKGIEYDEKADRLYTTIKFAEYAVDGEPLEPKYFTFAGNLMQLQSLVIKLDGIRIKKANELRGKNVYLFWKVFMLAGSNTQEYEITGINKIPEGYKIRDADHPFEKKLWSKFWEYALDPKRTESMKIRNIQIRAPGTMFVPGTTYSVEIAHDGEIGVTSLPLQRISKKEALSW